MASRAFRACCASAFSMATGRVLASGGLDAGYPLPHRVRQAKFPLPRNTDWKGLRVKRRDRGEGPALSGPLGMQTITQRRWHTDVEADAGRRLSGASRTRASPHTARRRNADHAAAGTIRTPGWPRPSASRNGVISTSPALNAPPEYESFTASSGFDSPASAAALRQSAPAPGPRGGRYPRAASSPSAAAFATSSENCASSPRERRIRAVDLRAQVEVVLELQRLIDKSVQRAPRQPPVAHARIRIEPLHGDPIGGAFIGEGLAPTAGARAERRVAGRSRWTRCLRRY